MYLPISYLRKSEEPHDTVGHPVENVDPHLEGAGVDLVQLVEVAVHHGVVGQAVLLSRRHHDLVRDLLARCGLQYKLKFILLFT